MTSIEAIVLGSGVEGDLELVNAGDGAIAKSGRARMQLPLYPGVASAEAIIAPQVLVEMPHVPAAKA
jgi:hypothetical protein